MLTREFIFSAGNDDCHGSTLLQLAPERMLAAWFEGRREGDNGCAIRIAIRNEGAWQTPQTLAKIAFQPHWNPVLFRLSAHRIALYFKVGSLIASWRTFVMYSDNDAQEWSAPEELVPGDCSGGRGPVKNPPIRLFDRRILAPASVERGQWSAFVDISFDDGRHWEKSSPVPMPEIQVNDPVRHNRLGLIQPALWESAPGIVHMLLRSNNGRIYRSDSDNGGFSWSEAYPTILPNNNSALSLTSFPGGELLLAANLCESNWGNRHVLGLTRSSDNGTSWGATRNVEATPPGEYQPGRQAEFSYPTILALPEREFALTYTWHRRSIVFLRGTLDDLVPDSE